MKDIQNILAGLPAFGRVQSALEGGKTPVLAVGLSRIHKAEFVHGLTAGGRGAIVLTPDEPGAVRLCEELNAFYGEETALHYPARDFVFRPVEGVSHEYEHARLGVLAKLLDGQCRVAVASCEAAFQHTIPPGVLGGRRAVLRPGASFGTEQLCAMLLAAGYSRCDQVEGRCQFSQRGGIVDFFPPESTYPCRIELWGDEIDTISTFRVDTQRREDTLKQVVLSPAREVLFPSQTGAGMADLLERQAGALSGPRQQKARQQLLDDARRLRDGLELDCCDRYLPLVYPKPAVLTDYLGGRLLCCDEPMGIKDALRQISWQQGEDAAALLEEGLLLPGCGSFYEDFGRFVRECEHNPTFLMDSFARTYTDLRLAELVDVTATQLSLWGGDMALLKDDLDHYLQSGYRVAVLAGSDKGADLLCSDLKEEGLPALRGDDPALMQKGRVLVAEGGLPAGFEYPADGIAVLSSGRLVSTAKKKTRTARGGTRGDKLRSIADLTPGDYVVHISHGIGIFEGIVKKEVQGVVKDYIQIRYGAGDMLFVPVTQLDLVTKYIGGREEGTVKLNRLNSGEWHKTRQRVKAAVSDMARELIQLYARRQQLKGHAFPPDDDWQREFEDRFEYTETDDQLRCIREIKQDMTSDVPMDRLLCGDVGFGKTEVALRAAFKCVLDGKQCAVLVPTTILSWQHYQTFRRRMEGFPVSIELLSRFRSAKEQAETIRGLRAGTVDLVVGTHRLLQKDIQFKDLGLCIIDEEQRFGVAHKERFKELRGNVDVLTLSATPIPRTLNMAMSGIRDMSTIEEPPQDRHPVQTYVLEHDDLVITDAIRKELRRGGQVFYLHNRIESIQSCAGRLQQALPEARIRVAHGRMDEEEMSEIWRALLDHEVDILVCTTIIESGVDVPNCNTLIVEDADRMGLAQLYQLRGRVGRSGRRAYAYFTFRRGKVLTEVAEKRLTAIREFTAFGSGFRIAMRDLEIRGAGDILGRAQHGHMEAVGYDLYLRLLSEAVSEQQGKPVQRAAECTVDLQIAAHIPEDYISNTAQRIDIYKKIAAIQTEEDSFDMVDELIDRFGEPPAAVKGLVDVALLRGSASAMGFNEITQKGTSLLLYPERLDMEMAASLAARLRGRVMVSAGARPYITVRFAKGQKPLEAMREVLGIVGERAAAGAVRPE